MGYLVTLCLDYVEAKFWYYVDNCLLKRESGIKKIALVVVGDYTVMQYASCWLCSSYGVANEDFSAFACLTESNFKKINGIVSAQQKFWGKQFEYFEGE